MGMDTTAGAEKAEDVSTHESEQLDMVCHLSGRFR